MCCFILKWLLKVRLQSGQTLGRRQVPLLEVDEAVSENPAPRGLKMAARLAVLANPANRDAGDAPGAE